MNKIANWFKGFTVQQTIVAIAMLGTVIAGLLVKFFEVGDFYWVEVLIVLSAVFVLLDALESRAKKQERKLDETHDEVVERFDSIETSSPEVMAASNESTSKDSLEKAKASLRDTRKQLELQDRREQELLRRVNRFVAEMDKHAAVDDGLSLSQLTSIRRIMDKLQTKDIYTNSRWVTQLTQHLTIWVYDWGQMQKEDHQKAESVTMVVLSDDELQRNLDQLLAHSQFHRGGIVVIPTETGDQVQEIAGFKEFSPVEMIYGVRFFYPVGHVVSTKLHRLVQY